MSVTVDQVTAFLTWLLGEATTILTTLGDTALVATVAKFQAALAAGGTAIAGALALFTALVNDFLSYGSTIALSWLPLLLKASSAV